MKKLINNCKTNVKNGFKTTVIGILLMSLGFALIIDQRANLDIINLTGFISIIIGGIAFILFPDDFIKQLNTFIINKFKS